MPAHDPIPTFGPKPWVKWVVSTLVLFNFFCIFTVVTGTSGPIGGPAVLPNQWYTYFTRYYVQPLFLTNPYQFYAPNPGPTNIVWFRVQYEDDDYVWMELPNRDDFVMRMPYQRNLCLAMFTEPMLTEKAASPDRPGEPAYRLSDMGKTAISSYVRHVAHLYANRHPTGANLKIKNITAYRVAHWILQPMHVRMGWPAYDIRSYNMWDLGTYEVTGKRIEPEHLHGVKASEFVRDIFVEDVFPIMKKHPEWSTAQVFARVGLPKPFRELAARFPEIVSPNLDKQALHELVLNAVELAGNKDEKIKEEKEKWERANMYVPYNW